MEKQTTKQRNQHIAILYEIGTPVKLLAADYKLSEGTIRNIIFGAGATRNDVITKRHEEMLALVDAGVKKTDVAKQFKVSPSAVSNIVAKRAWKLDSGT